MAIAIVSCPDDIEAGGIVAFGGNARGLAGFLFVAEVDLRDDTSPVAQLTELDLTHVAGADVE